MKYLKDSGFIIKRTNLFESDRYITIFTKEHGKVEVLAKGVRKINSRKSPHLELLNLVQFYTVKTKTNNILTDIEVVHTYAKLREDYANVGVFFLICELVDKLCPEGIKHTDIFNLIEQTLNSLGKVEITEVIYNFQVTILTYLGFWDPAKKFKNDWEIDRFIEDVVEKKIKSKVFLKL